MKCGGCDRSAAVRRDALNGLQELVLTFDEALIEHSAEILNRGFEMLTDSDKSVRAALLQLLKTMFKLTPEQQMGPFLEPFMVFLETAVTHDIPSIRQDAMGMLQAALEAYPVAIAPRLSGIVPRLFQLFCTTAAGKTFSLEWRISALATLTLTLKCVFGQGTAAAVMGATADDGSTRLVAAAGRMEAPVVSWNGTAEAPMELVVPAGIGPRWSAEAALGQQASMDPREAGSGGAEAAALRVQTEIQEYLPRLLPVVWQSWLECSPSEPNERTAHAADMLLIIRTLLYLFQPAQKGNTDDSGDSSALPLPSPRPSVHSIREISATRLRDGRSGCSHCHAL